MSETIASALPSMAKSRPEAVALWLPQSLKSKPPVTYRSVTFAELNGHCERTMAALHHVGVKKGTHVAVMVKPGLEFFSLTFALFQLGALPVLIDPGIGLKALKACLAEARGIYRDSPSPHSTFDFGLGEVERSLNDQRRSQRFLGAILFAATNQEDRRSEPTRDPYRAK